MSIWESIDPWAIIDRPDLTIAGAVLPLSVVAEFDDSTDMAWLGLVARTTGAGAGEIADEWEVIYRVPPPEAVLRIGQGGRRAYFSG